MNATLSRALLLLALPIAALAQSAPTNAPSASAPATDSVTPLDSTSAAPASPAAALLRDAFALIHQGDLDGGLVKIDAAERLDPKNLDVYLMRGSIYGQKKIWDKAQHDYETALSLAPDKALIRFNLAELQFMQRKFENARPGFASVTQDPDVGDLASFKVFLCDLMLNHQDAVNKELADFNAVGEKASYYYANAAWAMAHNQLESARGWLTSAAHIFSPAKNALYSYSLNDLAAIHAPTVSFVTVDGKKFENVQALLEENDLRVLTSGGWVAIPFTQLPATLSSFPEDWQYKIAARRAPETDPGIKVPLFTTRKGDKYTDVAVFVESTGLRVRTTNGLISVAFEDLPDDLSALPAELQKQIAAQRRPALDAAMGVKVAAFTTKSGQKYENVEVLVEDDDVRVHAPSGWVPVPFNQLPDDLSAFPQDLQNQITARRAPAPDAAAGIKVPLLTTRSGEKYPQASVFVESTGLRVRTAAGLTSIPFDQLPDDLSTLPPELQKQIAARRPATVSVTSGIKVPSLITRQGEKYNNAEVFVESSGLRLRTTSGFVNISFDQLPDDISNLPPELQKQIAAMRRPTVDVTSGIKVPRIDTRDGQHYENVEVFVESTGLRLRTANGFVSIPFEQLPKDLSSLPSELRKQIAAKQKPAPPSNP